MKRNSGKRHNHKFTDLTGQKFCKLTVVGYAGRYKRESLWECECECGNTVFVLTSKLKKGRKKSCGCSRNQLTSESNKTHGHSGERLYRIYILMIRRCENPKAKCYENYGGRGITVCDEWKRNVDSFYKWALSNGYRDDLTIDRIDNNKGYSPDNCRWATKIQQQNNMRTNNYITFNNETHTLSEWSRIVNKNTTTISGRLRRGWSIEDALFKDINIANRNGRVKEA